MRPMGAWLIKRTGAFLAGGSAGNRAGVYRLTSDGASTFYALPALPESPPDPRGVHTALVQRIAAGLLVAVLVTTGAALQPAVTQAAVVGSLSQLPVPNDCIQAEGSGGSECGTTNAAGLYGAQDVAVSPDGKNVYAVAWGENSVVEFARNSDGSLTQLAAPNNCITGSNSGGRCGTQSAPGLETAHAAVVSPDGKNVYVISLGDGKTTFGAIAEFTRNPDGSLTQLSGANNCIEEHGGKTCGTTTGHGLDDPASLAITPDGKNVYVSDIGAIGPPVEDPGAVAEFSRDPNTGALTELGCIVETHNPPSTECATSGQGLFEISAIVASSDNKNVYTAEQNTPGAIAEFARSPVDGSLVELGCLGATGGKECASNSALGIDDIHNMDLSPDGHNLYSASIDAHTSPLAEFSRDPTTGLLSQLANPNECIEEHGAASPVGCGTQTGHGLSGAVDIKVSPDGRNAYVVGNYAGASATLAGSRICGSCGGTIAEFARDSDGALTQLGSPNDCLQLSGFSPTDCGTTNARGIHSPQALALSPDGADVYVASEGSFTPDLSSVAEFGRVGPGPPTPPQGFLGLAYSSPPSVSQPTTVPATPVRTKPGATHRRKPKVRILGTPSACTSSDFTVKVVIASAETLMRDAVKLDGRRVPVPRAKTLRVRVSLAGHGPGRHHITVSATNRTGTTVKVSGFTACAPVTVPPRFTG